MSKLRKATKKITAVAASTAIVASSVIAGGLSNYPSNFVEDGKFNGQVVVGASADAMDTTNANAIIADLEKEFSGESEKVKITYKKSAEGGEELDAVRSNNELNYGESIGNVTEQAGFDNSDSDMLEDGRFDNGVSDEDYEQNLKLENGVFNFALRDDAGMDEIAEGIYYKDGQSFAKYTLEMDNDIDLSGADFDEDFIGETLTVMGNEFTIGAISRDGSNNLEKLELLGGANKVSLGEGETTTVTVEGKEYEIAVDSVSEDKVLLSVNGQSESIDEYDSEEVAGINLAVTDLVESSRDSVKGYAEVVVGGQKITLENSKMVQINEEDLDEVHEDYEVYATFSGTGLSAIELDYQVTDDIVLEQGDALEDVLFQAFRLEFVETNEPEYTTVEFSVNDDDVEVSGVTEEGEDVTIPVLHMGDKTDATTSIYAAGADDEDRMFMEFSTDLTGAVGAPAIADGSDAVLNLTDNVVKGLKFLMAKDLNEQYLYELTSVDTNVGDNEVDFDEELRADNEENIKRTEWNTKLGVTGTFVTSDVAETFTLDTSAFASDIAFENEVIVSYTAASEQVNASAADSTMTLALDTDDTDADESTDDTYTLNLAFSHDADDEEFNIAVASSEFVNVGNEDNKDGDSDVQTFVTAYGTKVEYDNDENTYVKVMTPEEQVKADVQIIFGAGSSEVKTVTVDADEAEAKVAELEEEGYTVTDEETIEAEEVEFEVSGVTLDSDVSGAADMIVVGGPAVNEVARELLGVEAYTADQAGVSEGEGVVRFFEESNTVLVYGYSKEDTTAAVEELNAGGLSGEEVKVE